MPRYFYNGQEVGVEELMQSAEGVGLSLEDFISKVALLDEGFEVKPDEPIKQVSAINVEQPEQPQFDASIMETFVRDSIKEIKSDPEKEKLYDKTRELADLSRRKVEINRNYKLEEDDYPTIVEFDEWGLPKQQDVFLPNGNVTSQPVTKKANVDQVEDMANFIKVAFDKKFNTLLSSEVSSLKDIQEGQEDAFTDKLDQYKDEVFAEFKKQYPSMSKDFFIQLAGNTYSNGAIAQSLNENIAKEEKEQSKKSFLNSKDLDLNYMNSRLGEEYARNYKSDPRFAQKININNKIKANYDELEKLDPNNPEDIDRINELETSNKVLMNDIQKLADTKPSWADEYAREYEEIKKQYGSRAAQDARLGLILKSYYKMSDANAASDELATSYMSFENSKYEYERSTEAKENYSRTFETEFNAFQEGNPTLTKRKAYEQFLKAKLYEEQQVEKFGLETMITIDPSAPLEKGSGRGFRMMADLRNTLVKKGVIERGQEGEIQVSLKDIFDAGYDGRDFDSWFDMEGAVSKEDVEKLLSYESAKYRSKAAVSTTYDLLYLNNDPGSLDRSPGAFRLFAETAAKATLTHFSDTSPEEAEKIVAGGSERTRSAILDKFEQHVGEYNNFYSEQIGKGEVEKLEFTKEQIEALEKSFGEEVGEGVGHFVPMLIELGVLTAATGGVLNVTGGARFLHALKNGKAIKNISTGYQKAMYHGMMAMIEEGKMAVAGFNPGTGAAFYGVGAATSGIQLKGRFAALNPFFQKVVKAGPVGAVASQTSVVVENAVQDLMDNKDFATEVDAHFKDFTFKDVVVESIVFSIVGAQHLKSRDLMSTNRKIDALAEVRLNIDKELKKENPNNDKLNSFRKAEQALNQMVLTETGAIKLDVKSENFEKDYSNVYIKPIEAALRRLDPNYKGIEVKFVEGKETLSEATNDAEFRYKGGKEGKDLIIIDKNAWEPGKSTHENTHALMENYFNRNPELAVRFSTNMAKIFKAANFKTQDGTPLDIAIKKAYELDLRKSKDKVTAAKEYLAYMTEILTNPEVYYREVAPTMFKQMRQEFISMAEENFGYRPKIKNARQFVELMGRFSQDARRGLGIEMKAARLADLQEFDFLGIEFIDAQGKVVVNNLASKNLNQKVNKSLAEKTKLIEANKKLFAEGKSKSQEFINNTNKIKEINSSIDKATKNIEISKRNEKLFKEYEPVDKLFKETQDPGASLRRSKLFEQIRENNRGILDNYINSTFQTVQGSKVTRDQFTKYVYNTEFNKLLNSYMNRGAELKDVPFGAYLQLPNTLNLRTGNILKALQQGEAVGRETSLDVLLEKGYDPAISSEAAGISASTSRAYEANGKRLVEEFNVPQTVVEKIMTEAGKVEVEGFTYKNLKDLAPEFANQMVGVEPKKGNISKGSVANAQKWFSDPKNAQLFIDLLPNGAVTEGKAGTKDIFGTATGVENVLLKEFYTKGERAETGPGLAVQSKNSNIKVSKVQEFFGINADGTTTYNRNLSSKVKAAVNQIGKAITNQVVRENIKTDPRFDFINKVEEIINRLEAGKSDALATKDILGYYKENNIKGRPLADIISFMKDPESFEKNNPKKFKALKDIIENEAVKEAEIGREAEVQFTKETKKLPYEWAQNGSYQVSQAKFKQSAELIKEFQNNSFDVAGIIPLEAAMILGNGKVMVDLFTGHYGAVRGITQMDKVNSPFKKRLRAELTNGKESPLSKELQERWKKFDWEKLTTSYASEFYTGLKDAYKLNTLKEQREAIFKFANSDKGKLQVELYDLWNSTLQEWAMLETPGSKRYNEKMNYIARIKKHNSVIGTTGERILAPAGYYYIPGVSILEKGAVTKDVKKIVKFEHLKSSSEMSYESLALIAEGMWTTKGTQALSKYRGIWGLLKDFDMVDKATGKTNSADIHRMAKSLELAKNIYSVKSGLKETLYSEIVKDIGIKEVNKIVSADKTITKQSIKKLKDAGLYYEGTTNVMASRNLKLHDKALENARKKNKKKKGMSTFDFDDTLAFTKSGVRYEMPNPSGKPAPQRKAILLMGSAGAGKTTVIEQLGLRKQGFKYINQDVALDWLSKNNGLPKDMNNFTRQQTEKWRDLQYEAASAAKDKASKLRGKGDGVIIDSTGGNIREISREFKDAGYDVQVVHVNSSLETALARNRSRTERRLTDTTVKNSYEKVQQSIKGTKELVNFFPKSVREFVEINTDKLKQGQPLPAEFVKKINDFTSGYIKGRINAERFALEGAKLLEQGAKYDFSEFNKVVEGSPGPLLGKAIERAKKFGTENMFVLTARPAESAASIREFLKSQGLDIPLKNITGLGNSTGEAKAMWMVEKFAEGYNDMYFVDDALPNVKAVKKALSQLDIKSDVQQALASKNLNLETNKIMEYTFNIPAAKKFTKAEGKQRGKDKKRRRLFMPDTASDLELLLEPLYGKGKKGIENKKWFDENLTRKYERGINDFNNARQTITNGYLALRKANKDIVKKLPENVEGTNFTLDQALRVYIWNKNGYNIPDLAKSTQKKLVSHVIKDPRLQAYAERLAKITKVEGGLKEPSAEWWAETIATEISDLGKGIGREKYLADFIQARKEIFSEANLNKMEAELGSGWRETIEDMFDRMETGRTRSLKLSKTGAAIINYLNGSVGTIMNFNTRSGVLQLISSVNFINHSFNNPLKATQAFLNQPQYWKDFMYIMNSNMLKQRRAGLQINVTEAELASAVQGKQNPAKAAMAHLIKAGYLPTKIADSFAIAAGGATYYRNLIKKYMKEGMSKSQAEKQAFIDFQVVAERTQQSSRADLLSQQQTSLEGRLILAFANTPMQMNRIMMKEILDLSKGRYKGSFGDNSFTHKMSRIAYFGAVQSMIFAALQSGLLALITNEDEEDRDDVLVEEKKTMALNTVADSFLRGMGIQGAVLSGVKNAILEFIKQNEKGFGADYSEVAEDLLNISPTIGSKFSKLDAAGNTYSYNKKLIEAEGLTLNGPLMEATTQTTEALFNIPTHRAYKKLNNINNALTGGYEDWQATMILLGWSNWDVGAGTPRVINKGKENEYIRYETAEDIRRREAKEMLRSSKKKRRTTVTFPD